jgi:hypothetical protein
MFCGKQNEEKIEKVQKRALRFMYKDYEHEYNTMLELYKCDSIKLVTLRTLACEVFKCIHEISPAYQWDIFTKNPAPREGRNSNELINPKYNTVKHGFLSFRFYGSRLYNQIPNEIRQVSDINEFKKLLKNWKGPTCKCERCIYYITSNMY